MVSKGFPENGMLSYAEPCYNRSPGCREERHSRQREQHVQRVQGRGNPVMFMECWVQVVEGERED